METFQLGIRSNLHRLGQLRHVLLSAASCAGLWWSRRACDQAHQGAETLQGSCIESSQPSFMLFMWVRLKDAKSKRSLKVGCSWYSHFEVIGVQRLRHSKVIRLQVPFRASHLQAVQQREWRCSGSAAAIGILCWYGWWPYAMLI